MADIETAKTELVDAIREKHQAQNDTKHRDFLKAKLAWLANKSPGWTKRDWYNGILGALGALAGIACVALGLWVIVPPIFFWWDWFLFCDGFDENQRDEVKHTHDLSRNIWVALVAVLLVLYNLDPWRGLTTTVPNPQTAPTNIPPATR
jgi:hypothetical protein